METIKSTTGLVFLPAFFVASIGTYFNMLQLMRLEVEQKFFTLLGILKFPWPLKRYPLFLFQSAKNDSIQ